MFGLGSIGNFLPMIGSLGMGFSGGGLFSLGFTLLSGLLTNITSPKNPGIENFATHPGFSTAYANPGFGTMGGGPNVGTFGSMAGYFGSNYTTDYSILPQTQSGQYYNNSCYCYGNQGVNYSPNAPITYGQQPNYGQQMGNMQFGGSFPGYLNQYNSVLLPQSPNYIAGYQYGQSSAMYGSAPSPYQQGYQPVMSHYGFGTPQQYNPASTLYGQQNGSVQMNYGRPTYGGPQDCQPTVINNHYHIHIGNETATNCPAPPAPPTQECPPPPPEDCPTPPVAQHPTPTPAPPENCEPQPQPQPYPQPPVANCPPPPPEDCPPEVSPVTGTQTVDRPAQIVATNSSAASAAASQTRWGRVPYITNGSDWGPASQMVASRITGGDSSMYSFGGRDIFQNGDGRMPERTAVWHVFQQNESLRLDAQSGYFYKTNADGSTTNCFTLSSVADLERQAGSNHMLGAQMVGDYLLDRNMAASGVTHSFTQANRAEPVRQPNIQASTVSFSASAPQKGQRSFG